MADVVRQRQRLSQFRIQAEGRGQGARDLRDFKRVGQAAAEVVRRATQPGRRVKTWVLPARRRKARACRMRAASRAKGVR